MALASSKQQKKSNIQEFTTMPVLAETWQDVLQYGTKTERPRGYELLSSGTCWKNLYYLAKGEVRLIRLLPDGRERILWVGVAPSIVGECPFFDQLPSNSSLILSKPSTLYVFSEEWIHNTLLVSYPKLTLSLLQNMANKLRLIHNQNVCVSMDSLSARVCKFLHQRLVSNANKNANLIELGLTQQELANLLSTHRVTLNKALRKLEKENILSAYCKKEIYILDMERFLQVIKEIDE